MAEEQKTNNEDFPLTKEEATRKTPRPTEGRDKRDRTGELPADTVDENEAVLKEVNGTANQTIDDGSKEIQGKLAVPHAKVQKRGSTLWTDEDGVVHKELNNEEVNADIGEESIPNYLKLHQEVVEGADPLEATLKYQGAEEKEFREGALQNAETHPRTMGRDAATAAERVQKEDK